MQTVVHDLPEEFEVAGAERLDDERCPPQVEHGVRHRHLGRQPGPCRPRREGQVGHGERDVHVRDEDLLRQQAVALAHDDRQAAEQGRGDVVGVALEVGGHLEQLVAPERAPEQLVGAKQAGDDGGRARAETGGERHAHPAVDAEAGRRSLAGLREHAQRGLRRQVLGVSRQPVGALAVHVDDDAFPAEHEAGLVPQVECEAQAVEPGTQVARRRRHTHRAALQTFVHGRSSTAALTSRPRP